MNVDVTGSLPATRILVVSNMFPSGGNPANGVFVKETLDVLRQAGLSVDILLIRGSRSPVKYGVGAVKLWLRLIRRKYDLIHAYYVYSGIVARMQPLYPVIVTLCGSDVNLPSQRRFSKWLCSRVAKTIVQTTQMKNVLGHENAVVLPFGVNVSLFVPTPRTEARERLGLNAEGLLALFPYDPRRKEKRYDLFVRAVGRARDRIPRLETLVLKNVPRELVPVYMSAADVMVLTSQSEGSPGTVKEALACGLPIVSVDVGDVKDLLEGVDGCSICERDEDSIALGIAAALSYGKRTDGRNRALELSTDAVCSRLLALYAEVLGRKRALSLTGTRA
jgi:glycosyltransferase involved in cell wall biosynthesis